MLEVLVIMVMRRCSFKVSCSCATCVCQRCKMHLRCIAKSFSNRHKMNVVKLLEQVNTDRTDCKRPPTLQYLLDLYTSFFHDFLRMVLLCDLPCLIVYKIPLILWYKATPQSTFSHKREKEGKIHCFFFFKG